MMIYIAYTLWGCFNSVHHRHSSRFKGSSQGFQLFLTLFNTISITGWLLFIGYYWYQKAFLAALILFGVGLAGQAVWSALMALSRVPIFVESLIGFVAIPLCVWILMVQL